MMPFRIFRLIVRLYRSQFFRCMLCNGFLMWRSYCWVRQYARTPPGSGSLYVGLSELE